MSNSSAPSLISLSGEISNWGLCDASECITQTPVTEVYGRKFTANCFEKNALYSMCVIVTARSVYLFGRRGEMLSEQVNNWHSLMTQSCEYTAKTLAPFL